MPVEKGFKAGIPFPVHLTDGCLHLTGIQVVPLALPAPERTRYDHGKMLPCQYCEENGRGSDSEDGHDHGADDLGAEYVNTCIHMCMLCNPARTQGLLADKDQTNPIWSEPPGGKDSFKLIENLTYRVTATGFGIAEAFGHIFIYAIVVVPHYHRPGYINMWRGTSHRPFGVLYCTVSIPNLVWAPTHPLWGVCLCGEGCNRWAERGWVCCYLQMD